MSKGTASYLNRAHLLLLLQMLYEKTDDENKMTTHEIIEYLKENGLHSHMT